MSWLSLTWTPAVSLGLNNNISSSLLTMISFCLTHCSAVEHELRLLRRCCVIVQVLRDISLWLPSLIVTVSCPVCETFYHSKNSRQTVCFWNRSYIFSFNSFITCHNIPLFVICLLWSPCFYFILFEWEETCMFQGNLLSFWVIGSYAKCSPFSWLLLLVTEYKIAGQSLSLSLSLDDDNDYQYYISGLDNRGRIRDCIFVMNEKMRKSMNQEHEVDPSLIDPLMIKTPTWNVFETSWQKTSLLSVHLKWLLFQLLKHSLKMQHRDMQCSGC